MLGSVILAREHRIHETDDGFVSRRLEDIKLERSVNQPLTEGCFDPCSLAMHTRSYLAWPFVELNLIPVDVFASTYFLQGTKEQRASLSLVERVPRDPFRILTDSLCFSSRASQETSNLHPTAGNSHIDLPRIHESILLHAAVLCSPEPPHSSKRGIFTGSMCKSSQVPRAIEPICFRRSNLEGCDCSYSTPL